MDLQDYANNNFKIFFLPLIFFFKTKTVNHTCSLHFFLGIKGKAKP